jgi:S-adenosylmethionine:tRNA ribosyltransferase-isomerase
MKHQMEELQASEFQYELPESHIAKYPLAERSDSKLLVYEQGILRHLQFKNLPELIDQNYSLVFNNTRVIAARIHFQRSTGARVEIFLLQPAGNFSNPGEAMLALGKCQWFCMIGNLKKWGQDEVLYLPLPEGGILEARLIDRTTREVHFTWTPAEAPWHRILESIGKIPLPPYLNREHEDLDKEAYQTVYASREGAVAAPTAGLHFTEALLDTLHEKGVQFHHLTLHVSAGTFQPLQDGNISNHPMHKEQILTDVETITNLIKDNRHRIAVGTTSLRSLESLYWYGQMLELNPDATFFIPKLYPYEVKDEELLSRADALQNVLNYMERHKIKTLQGETEIMIMPGYRLRNADSLITNFHQPGSTLLVLISVFTGDKWKEMYTEALSSNYRFLSYGDSSWLIPQPAF